MTTEAEDRVQQLADIMAPLPVADADVRAWLDERGIPVFVGVQALFGEVWRTVTGIVDKLLDERDAARADLAIVEADALAAFAMIVPGWTSPDALLAALAEAQGERDELRQHVLDIDAHATPYGDIQPGSSVQPGEQA